MDSRRSSGSGRRYSGQSIEDVYDKRYKAAVLAYQNYMEGFHLVLSENERKMREILNRRSVPLWFQELSNEQVHAMDGLLEAIQDDLDEGTLDRSRSAIRSLGVYPICPSSILETAQMMSRGNDISFLWFLLELHYSKNQQGRCSEDYSINERLLMSSICHLDMMTTLRGLEKVLPPREAAKSSSDSSQSSTSHNRIEDIHYCSPYLESLWVPDPRPKNWTEVRNFHPEAPFSLSRYAPYKDPDFIIPNEISRWFAKKAAANQTKTLDEAVQTDDRSKVDQVMVCGSAEQIVKGLLNDQIALMVRREDEMAELCRKHRDMEKRRQKLLGLIRKRTEGR